MNLFESVSFLRPKKAKFDLSHERKLTFQMGELVPTFVADVVPGDSFKVRSEALVRFAPMLAPIMHRIDVWQHFFFVPHRLVWSESEDFFTGGRLGTSTPAQPVATVNAAFGSNWNRSFFTRGTLADYLGLPVEDIAAPWNRQDYQFCTLAARSYQLIWNEFYRDQNLTAPLVIPKTSGMELTGDAAVLMTLRSRCWEKDYLTSALPFQQRGTAVSSPLSGVAPVTGRVQTSRRTADDAITSGAPTFAAGGQLQVPAGTNAYMAIEGGGATLSAGGVNINELRRSLKLQEWLERNARAGGRYIEQILAHFGVRSSDARLQRPQYLGGGKTPVVISEVLSTFEGTTGPRQGNMAGHGVAVGDTNLWKGEFEEHGFIIGLTSVLPKTAYQQGMPRMFNRQDRFEYLWPEFAHIGEQAVLNQEVMLPISENTTNKNGIWGYQSRYAEYKYMPSTVHGDFKGSLSFWHAGRIFGAFPPLNENFVQSDPTQRIFAVTDPTVDKLYCQVYNQCSAVRPLPYFDNPGLM